MRVYSINNNYHQVVFSVWRWRRLHSHQLICEASSTISQQVCVGLVCFGASGQVSKWLQYTFTDLRYHYCNSFSSEATLNNTSIGELVVEALDPRINLSITQTSEHVIRPDKPKFEVCTRCKMAIKAYLVENYIFLTPRAHLLALLLLFLLSQGLSYHPIWQWAQRGSS